MKSILGSFFFILCLWSAAPSDVKIAWQSSTLTPYSHEPFYVWLDYTIPSSYKTGKILLIPQNSSDVTFAEVENSQKTDANGLHGRHRFMVSVKKSGSISLQGRVKVGLERERNTKAYEKFKDISTFDMLTYTMNSLPPIALSIKPVSQPYVGDFTIKRTIAKKRVFPNDPIHIRIEIEGKGNIEAIKLPPLMLQEVKEFHSQDECIVSDTSIHQGKKIFTMALSSAHSLIVPALSIPYFSPTKGEQILYLPAKTIDIIKEKNLQYTSLPFKERGENGWQQGIERGIWFILGIVSMVTLLYYFRMKKIPLFFIQNSLLAQALVWGKDPSMNKLLEEWMKIRYGKKIGKIPYREVKKYLKAKENEAKGNY